MDTIGEGLSTAFLYVIVAALMFGIPLMTISSNNDDIAQLSVQAETTKFVDNVGKTGVITEADYAAFEQAVSADGNAKEIEMQIGVLDENPAKKVTQANPTKYGENVYYYTYTSQNRDLLRANGEILLNQGSNFAVSVKNKYPTLGDTFNNFFYSVPQSAAYSIAAQASTIVTVNGGLSN